jgi:hypothetical protein
LGHGAIIDRHFGKKSVIFTASILARWGMNTAFQAFFLPQVGKPIPFTPKNGSEP